MSSYRDWLLSDYYDQATKTELEKIKDDEQEIEDRFYKELSFGTGGLRGKIGAGTNRMNIYTVRKATQGLANYIINYSNDGRERGVVIAYDSRHYSAEFALETALVLNGNGIKAYLFDELRPTPELSYAVRRLNAVGGVVITASHNPAEYNGYKVYWEDGGQIIPEQAREITAEIEEIDDFSLVKWIDREEAETEGLLKIIGSEIDNSYLEEVIRMIPDRELIKNKGAGLHIIYSPLHGTGNKPVSGVLRKLGFSSLELVREQEKPDPYFSTVSSPNPEEFSAFKLALKQAEENKADLILATDPDCDRMGLVVQNEEGLYTGLTGNQIGVLLTDYLLQRLQESGNLPQDGVIVKTIVTTEMVRKITANYGVEVIDVLTGFKFIGEKIKEFALKEDKTFIFGFEESYGYLAGTYARDKDAVVASALTAAMALYYKEKGMTIYARLEQLKEEYGHYLEDLQAVRLEGKEGQEKIEETLDRLRKDRVEQIADFRVEVVKDYLQGKKYDLQAESEEELSLPEANVLQFVLEDDGLITIRPSGTEPKLKIYYAIRGVSSSEAEENLKKIKQGFQELVKNILEID